MSKKGRWVARANEAMPPAVRLSVVHGWDETSMYGKASGVRVVGRLCRAMRGARNIVHVLDRESPDCQLSIKLGPARKGKCTLRIATKTASGKETYFAGPIDCRQLVSMGEGVIKKIMKDLHESVYRRKIRTRLAMCPSCREEFLLPSKAAWRRT